MAVAFHVLLLSLLACSVDANRVEIDGSNGAKSSTSEFANFYEGNSCANVVKVQKSCTVVTQLVGGMQADTSIVNIDGKKYVLKVAKSDTKTELKQEKKVIRELQDAKAKIPKYYLDFQAVDPQNQEILVIEFLEGWSTATKIVSESVEQREVRAAAFFVALDSLHEAQYSHCDLNPGNAMFKDDDPTKCKIIDFGLALKQYSTKGTCGHSQLPDNLAAWNNVYAALMGQPYVGSRNWTPGPIFGPVCSNNRDCNLHMPSTGKKILFDVIVEKAKTVLQQALESQPQKNEIEDDGPRHYQQEGPSQQAQQVDEQPADVQPQDIWELVSADTDIARKEVISDKTLIKYKDEEGVAKAVSWLRGGVIVFDIDDGSKNNKVKLNSNKDLYYQKVS